MFVFLFFLDPAQTQKKEKIAAAQPQLEATASRLLPMFDRRATVFIRALQLEASPLRTLLGGQLSPVIQGNTDPGSISYPYLVYYTDRYGPDYHQRPNERPASLIYYSNWLSPHGENTKDMFKPFFRDEVAFMNNPNVDLNSVKSVVIIFRTDLDCASYGSKVQPETLCNHMIRAFVINANSFLSADADSADDKRPFVVTASYLEDQSNHPWPNFIPSRSSDFRDREEENERVQKWLDGLPISGDVSVTQ